MPRRTCIGCRKTTDSPRLVRLARSGDATLTIGRSLQGRGAWICPGSRSCFEQAVKRDAFRRAFRAPVDRLAVDRLRSELFGGDA